MPLPANDTAWPPAQLAGLLDDMGKWSAWYEGTPEALRAAYGGGTAAAEDDARPGMIRAGGLKGALQRFWWGRPLPTTGTAPRDHLHVPIAADLCQASADLLFAEQPTVTTDVAISSATRRPTPSGSAARGTAVQDRLTELVDDGFYSTLAEAAEIGAALGSSYLRVGWDRDVRPDAPFLSAVDADGAWPEFRWGILRAVTFWTIVATEGQVVWRHLERHELDPSGVGVIQHGLYEGRRDNLGRAHPITDRPETAIYATAMGDDGVITTASPGLAVVFVPNQRPQRRWRKHPLGSQLGRSDLDGVEGHMDALDEVYSSWMRDVRLGKARLLLAKSLMDDLGPGKGARFDADREVFSPVNALAAVKDGGMPVEQVQFAIRFAEHQATARQMIDDILRTAGYSAQTFGEAQTAGSAGSNSDATATEIRARERRSYMTRDRKIRLWGPALAAALEKLLAVDVALFGGTYTPVRPDVEFPDGVQDSMLVLSQTALTLRQAEAASDETIVELLHPDWEPDQIDAEVRKIGDQRAAAVPDPTGFGAAPDTSGSKATGSAGGSGKGNGSDTAGSKQQ